MHERAERVAAYPLGGVRSHEVCDVGRRARSALGDDFLGERIEQFLAPRDDGYRDTFGGQPERDGASDPHAGAGDQRRATPQLQIHSQPFSPVSATLSMIRLLRMMKITSIGTVLMTDPAISLP